MTETAAAVLSTAFTLLFCAHILDLAMAKHGYSWERLLKDVLVSASQLTGDEKTVGAMILCLAILIILLVPLMIG